MKLFAALVLSVCLLCGCKSNNAPVDQAMDLRKSLLEGNGCTFSTAITADYGDRLYTFQMDCTADSEGNLTFTVTDPETICGITGTVSQTGGSLTFDDKVLAFPLLADGQLSPVCTPWIFINTLKSGYITGCSETNDGIGIYLDDSFDGSVLRLEVLADQENIPLSVDVFWNQKRILIAQIRNFTFL